MSEIRHDWTFEKVKEIYDSPLLELVFRAAQTHRESFNSRQVQVSTLLSIKTGGCSEDCAYCPQAARYHTDIDVHGLMKLDSVVDAAQQAKAKGASRFCMGAAWREVRDNRDFDRVIEMVKAVNSIGLEVCCTLGMLTEEQAQRLKDAGVYAYNHNLDSSEEFYDKIISTRTYQDRLDTIDNVRKAGMTVCCGGIIGMGEQAEDRIKMLATLANLDPQPESVPINMLVAVKGTPLAEQPKVSIWEMVRMVATARIVLPKSMVRLSAGRNDMSDMAQAFCFMAGANSIFAGDKLLTTPNPEFSDDQQLFDLLGLEPMPSEVHTDSPVDSSTGAVAEQARV